MRDHLDQHFRDACVFFHPEQRKLFARNFTHLQILARMSPLPVAKTPPVGLGATEITVTPRRHNVSFFHDFHITIDHLSKNPTEAIVGDHCWRPRLVAWGTQA